MSAQTVAYFARRARRRIDPDLPDDLVAGNDDIMGIQRWRIHKSFKASQQRENGLPAFDRTANFNLPSNPRFTRRSNAQGLRTFHMGFPKPEQPRSAAKDDKYATGKDERDRQRTDERALWPDHENEGGLELTAGNSESLPSAAAHDDYAASKDKAKVAGVHTNLRVEPDERQSQWDAIEAHERTLNKKSRERGSDRINVRAGEGRELVETIAADGECPAELRDQIRAAVIGHKGGRSGVPWVSDDAAAVHAWIRSSSAFKAATTEERKALRFSPGRASADHDFFDLELPAALGPAARDRIAARLAASLANLPGHPDCHQAGYEVPVVVVGHNPDRLNSTKNGHLHVVQARRRYLLDAEGNLVRDENGNLVAEAKQVPATWARDRKVQLRNLYAYLVNDELKAADLAERLHPGTNRDLEIDAIPQIKLGNAQTVLLRAGVKTPASFDNAIEAWRREFAEIDRFAAIARREADTAREQTELFCRSHANAGMVDRISRDANQLRDLHILAAKAAREAGYIETYIAMAESSTRDPIEFADGYADLARQHRRSAHDVSGWRNRGEEARAFRARQDLELEEERAAIKTRRVEIARLAALAKQMEVRLVADMKAAYSRASEFVDLAASEAPIFAMDGAESGANAIGAGIPGQASPLTAAELHRIVDTVAATPLLLSRDGDRYFVAAIDAPDAPFRKMDLNVPSVAKRLIGVYGAQERELRAVRGHVGKFAASTPDSPYVVQAIAKWSGQPIYDRLIEQFESSLADKPANPVAAPTFAVSPVQDAVTERSPQPPTPTVRIQREGQPDEIAPPGNQSRPTGQTTGSRAIAQPVPRSPSPEPWVSVRETRRRTEIDKQVLDCANTFIGTPKPNYGAAKLIDFHLADKLDPSPNSSYNHSRTGAGMFEMLKEFESFRSHLAKISNRELAAVAQLKSVLGTPGANEPWRDTTWVTDRNGRIDFTPYRRTQDLDVDVHDRFENMVEHDLREKVARRPPVLTREPDGLVGVYDDELLRRVRHNHLGLRLPSSQAVLVSIYLGQEVDRELAAQRRTENQLSTSQANHSRPSIATRAPELDREALIWRKAVQQSESDFTLMIVGETLLRDRLKRKERLATLSDEEKRLLRSKVSATLRREIPVTELPTKPSRKKNRRQRGKTVGPSHGR